MHPFIQRWVRVYLDCSYMCFHMCTYCKSSDNPQTRQAGIQRYAYRDICRDSYACFCACICIYIYICIHLHMLNTLCVYAPTDSTSFAAQTQQKLHIYIYNRHMNVSKNSECARVYIKVRQSDAFFRYTVGLSRL